MVAVDSRYIPGTEVSTAAPPQLSPVSPTPDSPCVTSACVVLPSLGLKLSGCEHKRCALAPLRIKKKIVALFPAGVFSPQQRQTLQPFPTGCYEVC